MEYSTILRTKIGFDKDTLKSSKNPNIRKI